MRRNPLLVLVLVALAPLPACDKGSSNRPKPAPSASASASAAALPDGAPKGACATAGLWGDFLEDGAYRCGGDQLPLVRLERCDHGTWTLVKTCDCQVTSSISGEVHASHCYDVETRGAARCGYALDSCFSCNPGEPCTTE